MGCQLASALVSCMISERQQLLLQTVELTPVAL